MPEHYLSDGDNGSCQRIDPLEGTASMLLGLRNSKQQRLPEDRPVGGDCKYAVGPEKLKAT